MSGRQQAAERTFELQSHPLPSTAMRMRARFNLPVINSVTICDLDDLKLHHLAGFDNLELAGTCQ